MEILCKARASCPTAENAESRRVGGSVPEIRMTTIRAIRAGWLQSDRSRYPGGPLMKSSLPLLSGFGVSLLVVTFAIPQSATAPRAFIDGDGPGWTPLTMKDFDNVNGEPDTWSGSGNDIHSTGKPVGVCRSK